jgi:flagellar biosynthesis protein FlhG
MFGAPMAEPTSTPGLHVRTIAVTSGKGGVGKTTLVVNLALELAMLGRSVTLLDADLSLANANVLLGIHPAYHIGHVLSGQRTLDDVAVQVGAGVRLIPGSSGVEDMANLSYLDYKRFIAEMETMENGSDFLIVDTPSGIANNVTGALCAASEVVVVTMPEPAAIIDAYATIKTLHKHSPSKPIWIVVNNAADINDGDAVFRQLSTVSKRFLGHKVDYLGSIPRDAYLAEAIREQRPIVACAPDRPASRSFRLIAKHLVGARPLPGRRTELFWESLKEVEV